MNDCDFSVGCPAIVRPGDQIQVRLKGGMSVGGTVIRAHWNNARGHFIVYRSWAGFEESWNEIEEGGSLESHKRAVVIAQ